MTKKLTLVFFGNEKLATGLTNTKPIIKDSLLAAGYEIEQVVTGPLDNLRPHSSKIAILAAYGYIIPQNVLDEFPLGIINIHPSLLPRYRGPTPIESAIIDGATKSGVSIMRLTLGMDEGPIYKQKSVKLTGRESKAELTETLQVLGAQLLVENLLDISSGKLKPRKQPHEDRDVSYSKKFTKQDGVINWDRGPEQVEREIRAFAGWPKSTTTLFGIDIAITEASVSTGWGAKSGSIAVYINEGLIKVQCNHGAIEIKRLLPAGRKDLSAKEFINGYRHKILTTESIEVF